MASRFENHKSQLAPNSHSPEGPQILTCTQDSDQRPQSHGAGGLEGATKGKRRGKERLCVDNLLLGCNKVQMPPPCQPSPASPALQAPRPWTACSRRQPSPLSGHWARPLG